MAQEDSADSLAVEAELRHISQKLAADQQCLSQGRIPKDWRAFAICRGCGPVLLVGAKGDDYGEIAHCPWCKVRSKLGRIPSADLVRRIAGKQAMDRPAPASRPALVRCGECKRFARDPLGNGSGIGQCDADVEPAPSEPALWAWAPRRCADFLPSAAQARAVVAETSACGKLQDN